MMEPARVKNLLESLLFVARKPLTLPELEQATALPRELLFSVLEEMVVERQGGGIQIVKVAGGYLMGTNPENAEYVQKVLLPKEETRLSPQSLETLAIIAYKQPVTLPEIERLRGVISDGVIETLMAKRLIKEIGRSEAVGRPYWYGTTDEFLRHFGLQDLSNLPPLPASEAEQETLFRKVLQVER